MHRIALQDNQEEEYEMRGDQKANQSPEYTLQLVELGQAQQEQAYGDLAGRERYEELGCVEVIVFQEIPVVLNR